MRAGIRSLGPSHQFQFSLFYVNTQHSAAQTFALVHAAMDAADRLAVIDAQAGVVTTWDRPPIAEINAIWTTR